MLHSAQAKKIALSLRKNNKSYSEITGITGIAKSTLSGWLSKENWSIQVKNQLSENSRKNYRLNQIKAVEANAKIKKIRDERFIREAHEQFRLLNDDPLFRFALGIYWGEGNKRSTHSVGITNTDPNMLKIIVKFYRECLKVDEKKLRVSLCLYENLDIDKATNFWSRLLGIPRDQFIKTRIVQNSKGVRNIRYKYGVCSLYFSNTELHTKILEWIRLLSLDLAGLA